MKIGIISDTHDNTAAVNWIIGYLNKAGIELALHAGDIINPGNILLFESDFNGTLHFVFGNNDGEQGRILQRIAGSKKTFCHFEAMDEEIAGKRVFMNHYSFIVELVAQSQLFDLAVGGHDHEYRTTQYGKTLFVNPGTTSLTDFIRGIRPKEDKGFVVVDLETMETERIVVPVDIY